jgi:hypothetical protein
VDIAQWRSDQKKMARPRSEAASHHRDKNSGHRQYKCDYIAGSASLVEPRFLIVTEALAMGERSSVSKRISVFPEIAGSLYEKAKVTQVELLGGADAV